MLYYSTHNYVGTDFTTDVPKYYSNQRKKSSNLWKKVKNIKTDPGLFHQIICQEKVSSIEHLFSDLLIGSASINWGHFCDKAFLANPWRLFF